MQSPLSPYPWAVWLLDNKFITKTYPIDFLSQEEAKNPKYPNGTEFSIPLNSRKIQTLMKYNPQLYNISRVTDFYYRYFEVALGYWLTHGNTSFSSDDYVTYKGLLGGQVDHTDASRKPNFQGQSSPSCGKTAARGRLILWWVVCEAIDQSNM